MPDNNRREFRSPAIWRTGPLLATATAAAAFALRVFHLAGQSLWYDEAFSVYLAGMGLGEIIARTAAAAIPFARLRCSYGSDLLPA
jgi:hypothetical protein